MIVFRWNKVKLLWGIGAIAVATLVLTPVLASGQAKKFAGVTLNIQVLSGHKQFNPVWDRLGKFEQETGMKVNLIQVPWLDIMAQTAREMATGGKRFDAYEVVSLYVGRYEGFVEPLNRFIEKDMSLDDWKAQFFPHTIAFATFDGDILIHPFYAHWPVGLYRADLFEDPKEQRDFKKRFGYELRTPENLQQLLDVALFFTRDTDNDGKIDLWGLLIPGLDHNQANLRIPYFLSGRNFFDDEWRCTFGPKYPENQILMEELARYLQNLIHEWKVVPTAAIGMGMSEILSNYMNGLSAMLISFAYVNWKESQLPEVVERIGVTKSFSLMPFVRGGGLSASSWNRAINIKSDKKGATWEFIKWACSKESVRLAVSKGPGAFIPPYIEVAEWAARQDPPIIPPIMLVSGETGRTTTKTPVWAFAEAYLREEIQALMDKQITPKKFVQKVGKKLDEEGQKAWAAKTQK